MQVGYSNPAPSFHSDIVIEMAESVKISEIAYNQFPKLSEAINQVSQKALTEYHAIEEEEYRLKESTVYLIHQNSLKIALLPFAITISAGTIATLASSILKNVDLLLGGVATMTASFAWLALPCILTCGQSGLEEEAAITKKLTAIQENLNKLKKKKAQLENLQRFVDKYAKFQAKLDKFPANPASEDIKTLLEELEDVLMLTNKEGSSFTTGLAKLILLEELSKCLPSSPLVAGWLNLKNTPIIGFSKALKNIGLWETLKLIPPTKSDYFYYFKYQHTLHRITLARHVENLLLKDLESLRKA